MKKSSTHHYNSRSFYRIFLITNGRKTFCGRFASLDLATTAAIDQLQTAEPGEHVNLYEPYKNNPLRQFRWSHNEKNNPIIVDSLSGETFFEREMTDRS